jgi:O-methyltransferase
MEEEIRNLYLDLLKRCLTNYIYGDAEYWPIIKPRGWFSRTINKVFRYFNFNIVRFKPFNEELRIEGRNWPPPPFAHTMIGLRRLDNIQFCIEEILSQGVPGDLIEAGVWRGGASIFMCALLQAYGIKDRIVWAADSFSGLPIPNPNVYPIDKGLNLYQANELAVSLGEVKQNFTRYNLLNDQIRFLEGWFSETLATAPIIELALIRIDADLYESTMEALVNLYPKLSVGGFVIIDDYGALNACRQAVEDYRKENRIEEVLNWIDYSGVYWKRMK